MRNQLNNHKVGEQFLMHIVKQQGAPSCTSNLCLQGIIKVDRQHKHTPTQRNGLACAGWPLDRGKKNKKQDALEMFVSVCWLLVPQILAVTEEIGFSVAELCGNVI